jgi:hypothetical protein
MRFANKCEHVTRPHFARGLCCACYNRVWNRENPEKVKTRDKTYRKKNRKKMCAKAKKRRLKHKALGLCRQCSEPGVDGKTRCKKHADEHAIKSRCRNYNYTPEDEIRFNTAHSCDWCGLPFNGETPTQDHDHACCSAGARSCGRCLRGLVHRVCNNHTISWFERCEKDMGITHPLLKEYRDRFPRRA